MKIVVKQHTYIHLPYCFHNVFISNLIFLFFLFCLFVSFLAFNTFLTAGLLVYIINQHFVCIKIKEKVMYLTDTDTLLLKWYYERKQ